MTSELSSLHQPHRMIGKNMQKKQGANLFIKEEIKENLMKIVINEIPPSNNKFIGRNARWQYQDEKTRWHWLIKSAIQCKPSRPFKNASVEITYFFKDQRRRDPDNYSGKMLLDPLVREGILQDDSFNNIELILKSYVDKAKPRTEIEILEVAEDD